MSVATVIQAKPRDLGDFVVRRSLPAAQQQMVGPFIFFDHMGPADFPPGAGIDVRPHPHINLATVTYLFEGELFHRDSTGAAQNIEPGAVNWMTAGSGIVHSERSSPVSRARHMHIEGIQSWVALPTSHEQVAPQFQHYPKGVLPRWQQGHWHCRLIAGTAFGHSAPVETHSPLFYVDCDARKADVLPVDCPYTERAIYVARGAIRVAGTAYTVGDFLVLEPGANVSIEATQPSRVMLLGGEGFPERRYIWWNFVSSSQRRLEDAKQRWQNAAFAPVAGEHEFIPLPNATPKARQ